MSVIMMPIPGDFLTCMEMYLSGQRTGTQQRTVRDHKPTLKALQRAPPVSVGAAPGTIAVRACVRPPATPTSPATAAATSASVSVSKKASNARNERLGFSDRQAITSRKSSSTYPATTFAIPRIVKPILASSLRGKSGATDRIRTGDPWYHKPVL